MRSRLALTLSLALLAACSLPASAFADGSSQGISRLSTLLEHTGVADLVYGVPVQSDADGVTGPTDGDSGFAGGDDDGDTSGDGAADASDESETPPSSGESGSYDDSGNTGLNNSGSGSEVSARTLLQIIIGIIFGQDRPWDDENRQKRG